MEQLIVVIILILRIFGAIYCSDKAGKLNRSKGGWGFFGFISPIVAIIWIQFKKPKVDWEKK
jgi:hypothetical protein